MIFITDTYIIYHFPQVSVNVLAHYRLVYDVGYGMFTVYYIQRLVRNTQYFGIDSGSIIPASQT